MGSHNGILYFGTPSTRTLSTISYSRKSIVCQELELLTSSGEWAGRHKLSWVIYDELSSGTGQYTSVNYLYLCSFDQALSLNKPRNLSGPKVLSYSKILTHTHTCTCTDTHTHTHTHT
jgi:hypothetical protein